MKIVVHIVSIFSIISVCRAFRLLSRRIINVFQRQHALMSQTSNWIPSPYKDLVIGVAKETAAGEKRVGLTPESAELLVKQGWKILVEKGAGRSAQYEDASYKDIGASVAKHDDVWKADIVVKVQPPSLKEVAKISNRTIVSFLVPELNKELLSKLQDQRSTAFAMDCAPKQLPRAQEYDALSSQAGVSGYRSVIDAAFEYGRPLDGGGSKPPAKVLVIGVGLAGIAAVETARTLGATVWAYDVRPMVRASVEALGATYLSVDLEGTDESSLFYYVGYARNRTEAYLAAELKALDKWTKDADIVICTAVVSPDPPQILTPELVRGMKKGSVVVDMAAGIGKGGNVAFSRPDTVITTRNGVKIVGYTDLPSRMANTASSLYGLNVAKFLLSVGPTTDKSLTGYFYPDYNDPAVRNMIIVDKGDMRYPNPFPYTPPPARPPPPPRQPTVTVIEESLRPVRPSSPPPPPPTPPTPPLVEPPSKFWPGTWSDSFSSAK